MTKEQCKLCNGDGFTAEHAQDMSCLADEHLGCPIQVQCDLCNGTGYVEAK